MSEANALLVGRKISKEFGYGKKKVVAVDQVDFHFHEGEIISIVGESGSGKTTLAKVILGLLRQSDGRIEYRGKPRKLNSQDKRRKYWKDIQAIFQDPFSSFNQFYRVEKLLLDCIKLMKVDLSREEEEIKMREACDFVNLKFNEIYNKYPFEGCI